MRYVLPFLIGLLLLTSCSKSDPDTPDSPRIPDSKATSVDLPKINQIARVGEEVQFNIASQGATIDSVVITAGSISATFKSSTFSWIPETQKTGTFKMQVTVYCGDLSEIHYPRLRLHSDIEPEEYTYIVMSAYPHNSDDYTQGIFYSEDVLFESTGQRGESEIKMNTLITGESIKKLPLGGEFFGEGCTRYKDEIYQLTWTSGTGFVYDKELNLTRTFQFNTEGWGLTTKGDSLVMSDGSEKIYYINPSDFSEVDKIEVYNDEGKVDNLNELEFINGLIYANQYQTDMIHVIEPSTGRILKTINLSGLLTPEEAQSADVLNGIAYDKIGDRLFVTGKWWPWLFEIKLQPKNTNS